MKAIFKNELNNRDVQMKENNTNVPLNLNDLIHDTLLKTILVSMNWIIKNASQIMISRAREKV